MSDDIEYRVRQAINSRTYVIPDTDLRNYVLIALEDLLRKNGSSLAEKNLLQPTAMLRNFLTDRLIHEELNYDMKVLQEQYIELLASLNSRQREIYEIIKHSVDDNKGRFFFVYGHGGTGKTFLWKTLTAAIRSLGRVVLAVASSGIALLLLPGDRTAHSRFKIQIIIDECSTCQIRKGTQLARLQQQTSIIIWDEAPMVHRHCLEALDKTLRDIFYDETLGHSEKPFGGITVVLGGDFKQILPVIPSGLKSEIFATTMANSNLWNICEVFRLTEIMRLLQPHLDGNQREELDLFAK